AFEVARTWASVLTAMKSTPCRPAAIMRLSALLPPPPTPTTFSTANRLGSRSSSNNGPPSLCLLERQAFSGRRANPPDKFRDPAIPVRPASLAVGTDRRMFGVAYVEIAHPVGVRPPGRPEGVDHGELALGFQVRRAEVHGDLALEPERQIPRLGLDRLHPV